MCNLIFDANNLFHRCKNVLLGEIGNLETSYQEGVLIRKVATDFMYTLKLFPNVQRVIWAQDHRSWRKDIEIEEGGYKAHRIKDDKFNWDRFNQLMFEFGNIVESKGGIYSNLVGAEADDLIMLWGNYFFQKGLDTVGVSADKDLQQTAKSNGDNYLLVYDANTKSRKLVAPLGFKEAFLDVDSEMNIFNMSSMFKASQNKDALKDIVSRNGLLEVDTKLFAFIKILHGDDGDNIPSVYWYMKNERKYKVSEKKAEKYYHELSKLNTFSILDLRDDDTLRTQLATLIFNDFKSIKDVDSQYAPDIEKISNKILRNISLVYLNYDIIPSYITTEFNKHALVKDKGNFSKNLNRINLLEGTIFAKDMGSEKNKGFSMWGGIDIDLPSLDEL